MPEKRDYYEVLSVTKTSTTVEIKKAYKKLALELHPDRNPGDAAAEEKFKEASEAYGVLADDDKRARYDRFGHAGLSGGGVGFGSADEIFTSFQDVFGDLFGFGGGRSRRNDGPVRGADLRVGVELTLKEAVLGTQKEVKLTFPAPCVKCDGSGAEGGKVVICQTCGGSGQVAHQRGGFFLSTTCPACRGAGRTAAKACPDCRGVGETETTRTLKVSIPAGIDAGQSIRVPAQGQPGRRGGPTGHLYVAVDLEDDPRFARDGVDLVHELHVAFTQAALGAKVDVETITGDKVSLDVPAGTQPGETLEIPGHGVPRLDGRGRGRLVCVVQIDVPKNLSAKAKKLLLELQDAFESQR